MTAGRIRVLYCTGDFQLGGTQRHLLSLARGLDRSRFAITVVSLSDRGALADAMRGAGVTLECLRLDRPLWHPRSLRAIVSLSRRIHGRFDIVHTLLGHANVVGLLAAGLAGHRRVLASQRSIHPVSGSFPRARPPLVALANLLFRHVARRVVVNNPAIAASLRRQGLTENRIVLLPNGIDLEQFHPAADRWALRQSAGLEPDALMIGFVGRMIPEKGIRRVIDAAEALVGRFATLRVVAVGDGPERAQVEAAAARGALRGRVDFLGSRADSERFHPCFDVLAFPSTYSEGTPNSVLEAMACGVPPVVHRMAQTESMIRDGDTGMLVDCDRPGALAGALERLLGDPRLVAAIGRRAREYVCTHHSLSGMLRAVERLYEEEMSR